MKPIKSLLVLAIVCAPALAAAQGYNSGPYYQGQPGFHHRANRLVFGVSVGLGGMGDNGSAITSCDNCNYNPIALELDAHLGGMIAPRVALMLELQVNGQTIHSDAQNGDTTVTQSAAMFAAQFWLLPQLWIKGGIGLADLNVDDTFVTQDLGSGIAVMGAIGFEIFSARNFAIDLQGRLIEGTYNSGDDHITSGTVGVGFNWY